MQHERSSPSEAPDMKGICICSRAAGRFDTDTVADGQRSRCRGNQDKEERTHASGRYDIDAVADGQRSRCHDYHTHVICMC